MKSKLTQLLTVSFVVASAIAVPTAVRAQSETLPQINADTAVESEPINGDLNYCFIVPGYGEFCFW